MVRLDTDVACVPPQFPGRSGCCEVPDGTEGLRLIIVVGCPESKPRLDKPLCLGGINSCSPVRDMQFLVDMDEMSFHGRFRNK